MPIETTSNILGNIRAGEQNIYFTTGRSDLNDLRRLYGEKYPILNSLSNEELRNGMLNHVSQLLQSEDIVLIPVEYDSLTVDNTDTELV